MDYRPIRNIERDRVDLILDVVGVLLLVLLVSIPAFYFNSLPDRYPRHFNASGEPDAYSGKWIVWLMPVIGVAMFVGLRMLAKIPHKHKYLVRLNEENVESAYRNSSRKLMFLAVIIVGVLTYSTYAGIQTALGNVAGLGAAFLPISVCLILGSVFFLGRKKIK